MHSSRGVVDIDIIRHCKAGSLKHQEMLYKQFYAYAMGVSVRYCFNREDAVEVVNDGFIKIFNSIKSYSEDKPFVPWLRSIMINTAIDRRRKEMNFKLRGDIEQASDISHGVGVI